MESVAENEDIARLVDDAPDEPFEKKYLIAGGIFLLILGLAFVGSLGVSSQASGLDREDNAFRPIQHPTGEVAGASDVYGVVNPPGSPSTSSGPTATAVPTQTPTQQTSSPTNTPTPTQIPHTDPTVTPTPTPTPPTGPTASPTPTTEPTPSTTVTPSPNPEP